MGTRSEDFISSRLKEGEFVEQAGVKGMKWGVRKDRGHEGERAKTKTIAKLDKKYDKSFFGMNGYAKVNNAIARRINPRIDALNSKKEYDVDLTDPKNKSVQKKYVKEYQGLLQTSLNEAMAEFGTNASGTRRFALKVDGEGLETTWVGDFEDISHADGDKIRIIPKFDSRGRITGQEIQPFDESIAQAGVKGMKWGVRRDRNPNYSNNQVKRDRQIYGRRGSARINKALNKGDSISVARGAEKTRRDRVMKRNPYARQAGRIAGAVGGVALSQVTISTARRVANSRKVTSFLGKTFAKASPGVQSGIQSTLIGARQITEFLDTPTVRTLVSAGAARIGYQMSGDIGVSVNMRTAGYDPNRK